MASQQAHTLKTRVEAVRSQYSVQRQPFEAVINVEYLLCPAAEVTQEPVEMQCLPLYIYIFTSIERVEGDTLCVNANIILSRVVILQSQKW